VHAVRRLDHGTRARAQPGARRRPDPDGEDPFVSRSLRVDRAVRLPVRASPPMTRAWHAWVELWDRREPATALVLVRIGVAVVLLGDFLWVWHEGLVVPLWSPPPDGFALG